MTSSVKWKSSKKSWVNLSCNLARNPNVPSYEFTRERKQPFKFVLEKQTTRLPVTAGLVWECFQDIFHFRLWTWAAGEQA